MLDGIFRLIGVSEKRPYDFNGRTGFSQKITLRDSDGTVIEVKCDPSFDFVPFLDSDIVVTLKIMKGGFVRAVDCKVK